MLLLTATRTGTPLPSATSTQTPLPTSTRTITSLASATSTQTPLPSSTVSPAASATAGAEGLALLKAVPLPNPQSGPGLSLLLKLRGRADAVKVTAFTKGWTKCGVWEARGSYHEGWNHAAVPAALPPGLYYLKLSARADGAGESALEGAVKVMLLP